MVHIHIKGTEKETIQVHISKNRHQYQSQLMQAEIKDKSCPQIRQQTIKKHETKIIPIFKLDIMYVLFYK